MKEEYKIQNKIIEEIRTMRNQFQIADYIEKNIAAELLEDDIFVAKLLEANPLVKEALEDLNGQKIEEDIRAEIEEKGLEAVIEDEEKLRRVPKEYRQQLFDIAKKYEEQEDFEKAKKIYSRIIDFGVTKDYIFNKRFNRDEKETIYYKARYSYYICKIQNGEELTDADREELNILAKEDKDNILNLRTQGEMTDYDLFEALFKDVSIEVLEHEILPTIPTENHPNGKNVSKSPLNGDGTHKPKDYIEELSPVRRQQFIMEHFDIEQCKIGQGKFEGYVLYKIRNSDVVIVEKFYSVSGRGINKQKVPSNNAATYVVHKDAEIDLENESTDRRQLVEKKKEEKKGKAPRLIMSINHRGEGYYDRLIKRFKKVEENGRKRRENDTQLSDDTEEVTEKLEETIESEESNEPIIAEDVNNPEIEEVLETIKTEAEPEIELEQESDIREEENNDETIEEIEEIPTVNNQSHPNESEEENIEETDEIDSEEVEEDLSEYSIEDLIALAQILDEDYEEIQRRINEVLDKIKSFKENRATIGENLSKHFKENLSRGNIKEIISEELAIMEEIDRQLEELNKAVEIAREEEKKNREERDRVQKEFENRIRGE